MKYNPFHTTEFYILFRVFISKIGAYNFPSLNILIRFWYQVYAKLTKMSREMYQNSIREAESLTYIHRHIHDLLQGFDVMQLWKPNEQSPDCSICIWSPQSRQRGSKDGCKVGKSKNKKLELKSISWNKWGQIETHIWSRRVWHRYGCPVGEPFIAELHTCTSQEWCKRKVDPGGRQSSCGPYRCLQSSRWAGRWAISCASCKTAAASQFGPPHLVQEFSNGPLQREIYKEDNLENDIQACQCITKLPQKLFYSFCYFLTVFIRLVLLLGRIYH